MTRDDIYKAASKELYGCLLNPKLRACLDENNRECFVDGAEWRINSVWHDNIEIPDLSQDILISYKNKLFSILIGGAHTYNELKHIDYTNWAYIKDLLPIKEGEND